MSSKGENRQTILIVGGGFAGAQTARQLSSSLSPDLYNIILVDGRPYFLSLPAAARLVVSDTDDLVKQALVPYDKLFIKGNGKFVQAVVKSVHQVPGEKSGSVILENGEHIDYHVLVVATGSSFKAQFNFPFGNIEDFVQAQRTMFAKATSVVLIGGGPAGLETAGEIKDLWPGKEVTVVHRGALPLNKSYPEKFRRAALLNFQRRGIRFVLEDSIMNPPSEVLKLTTITTKKGSKLTADLFLTTAGITPNGGILSTLNPSPLTASGFVKIEPTLQVPDFPNIFAAGDVMDFEENKAAAKTQWHSSVVTKNIEAYLKGLPTTKHYTGSVDFIVISNGKKGGVGYLSILWGLVFGDFLSWLFKSRTLMTTGVRRRLGY